MKPISLFLLLSSLSLFLSVVFIPVLDSLFLGPFFQGFAPASQTKTYCRSI
uniref:Uncharacterized protein n=1 Tax=Rhizophora mucronata TaxID=61149 RepID=A0A2P2Q5V5_RHIMU